MDATSSARTSWIQPLQLIVGCYGCYGCLLQGSLASVQEEASRLQEAVNCGNHSCLGGASVGALVILLERLLGRLTSRSAALSAATLRLAKDHHQVNKNEPDAVLSLNLDVPKDCGTMGHYGVLCVTSFL